MQLLTPIYSKTKSEIDSLADNVSLANGICPDDIPENAVFPYIGTLCSTIYGIIIRGNNITQLSIYSADTSIDDFRKLKVMI